MVALTRLADVGVKLAEANEEIALKSPLRLSDRQFGYHP
jgi:hypothetical protein